jgi:hypothetical protein
MAFPVAAVIGAALTAITAKMQADQQQEQMRQQANQKAMGGNAMAMTPAFNDPERVYGANAKTGQLPAQDPEEEAYRMESGMPSGTIQAAGPAISRLAGAMPESRMQPEIDRANQRENAGIAKSDIMMQRYPLTPTEAGQFGTGNLLAPDFGASGKDITKGGGKDGMSFDEKMQYAALAAQLGSALAGQGGPAPPGAPRGGGMNMAPVFQQLTARGMYGG